MDLYRIIPIMLHIIILLRIAFDVFSSRMGMMTRAEMVSINALYDKFLYLVVATTIASLFIGEKRLRLVSVLTGVVVCAAIWFTAATFTPEYHSAPMAVPAGAGTEEEEPAE